MGPSQKNMEKKAAKTPMCKFWYQLPWVFRSFADVQWGFEKTPDMVKSSNSNMLHVSGMTQNLHETWQWRVSKFGISKIPEIWLSGESCLTSWGIPAIKSQAVWVQLHENSPRNSLSSRYCHQTFGELCCAQSLELELLIRLGVSFFTPKMPVTTRINLSKMNQSHPKKNI